ncbi:MAG TPA: aminotransferase class V-fold PLP-dependent enzyme [bacterium]|nr:aminotransferase class V-fold PLP-dependent enzyme [bacterium]
MRVYADHGATTPVDPAVAQAMLPYFSEAFGNPGSIHAWGQQAREAVDRAREIVARALGARPAEIVFTGGATEADNFAVVGAALAGEPRGRHIVTTQVEHHAVLEPCRFLETRGFEVTYLPVDRTGRVDPADIRRALRDDTILVSVMHANNEIGTLQPVGEIAEAARARGIVVHTDAAQTVGILSTDVDRLGVDLLSVSAHKRYGPKGVGALYVRKGTPLARVQHGGAQERGRRGGTENVPGIVGFGEAMRIAAGMMVEEAGRLAALRDRLAAGLARIEEAHLNGHPVERLPGTVSVSFEGADSEALLMALDLAGVAASSGSACTSGSLEPSHVLRAIGLPAAVAKGTLRLSLGRTTTDADVAYLLEVMPPIVARLRARPPAARR